MKPSLREKLSNLSQRLDEINSLLSSEDLLKNNKEFTKLSIEHSEITPIVQKYLDFLDCENEINSLSDLLSDPEMKELATSEINIQKKNMRHIEFDLKELLLPKDPNDKKNIFLEIRAGTGGDESSLFALDLFKMYLRYAERKNWTVEVASESFSELGGYKEIIAKFSGKGVYSKLKFEAGGHRVQRVPETETQGRIHTSACTVAIMPEVDDIEEVVINNSEIRIDTYRASGAGGQHVNKTDSAVRITHLPTGIVAECQDDRSQHKNKAQAYSILAARIKEQKSKELTENQAKKRKLMVGSGDRSERIRTYNFPQGRVTDHRINLTLYKLSQMMMGDLDELIENLLSEHHAELLSEIS